MSHSAEVALLAASVVGRTEAARRAAIESAVRDAALDWDRVLAAVRRHRMAGFLHRALRDADVEPPTQVARELRELATSDAQAALRVAAEAVRLVRLMQAQDLPVMVLKGPAIAAALHGDLSLRQARDLDLLVTPEHVAEAMKICEAAGYASVAPAPGPDDPNLPLWLRYAKDISMLSRSSGVLLELHVRPVPNPRLSRQLDLWTRNDVVVLGNEMSVPAPGREALYAYLCTHGALHAWARLKWLADVAVMIEEASDEEIHRLHQAAIDRGVGRASGQALLLIGRVWGRTLPEDLARMLEADRTVRRLERLAWRVLTDPREANDVPFRNREVQVSLLLLEASWAYRLAELGLWLFDWETAAVLRLPRPLWGFYPLFKFPVWSARKLGAAARLVRPPIAPA